MNTPPNEIREYYDSQVQGKLRGFVEGNDRVECAWLTIEQWAGEEPARILEVGCGIGDIAWRMSQRWMHSHVVGLDVSQRSLRLAETLFGESRISFCEGPLVEGRLSGSFDLIVLMDVYEHIGVEDRRELHRAINELKNERTRIVLAFPTPRHLAWLKIHQPDRIQGTLPQIEPPDHLRCFVRDDPVSTAEVQVGQISVLSLRRSIGGPYFIREKFRPHRVASFVALLVCN